MLSGISLSLLAGAAVLAEASTIDIRDQGLEAFIAAERKIALQGVLNNIGPNGSAVPGAHAGYVVASPSKDNPNYFYTWTRDSALTLKMLIDEFILGGDKSLEVYITDYVHGQAVLQTVTNPSGSLLPAGTGLGEPKYNVDGTRFNGAWGRPQRDGPALRAIALITYANWLVEQGQAAKAKDVVWPVISNDLSYVGQYWNTTGFDLWEEVDGSSFFTTQNQYKSLVDGAALAASLGVPCAACGQAAQVLCLLDQAYWNGAFFTANVNLKSPNGRVGVDANTVLGPISVFDPAVASCADPSVQPCHSRALANFKVFVDTFRNASLYPINAGAEPAKGVALGRYPEDVYFGGNPWYLITLGAAEFLYDAAEQWARQGRLAVDETSLPFFRELYPAAAVGVHKRCRKAGPFRAISDAARAYADSFVAVAQRYTPAATGALSEQFLRREPGTPLSARDLTWSYAAFVSMAQRRAGLFPPAGWTSAAPRLPESCAASSAKGVYAPAAAAGAPNVTVGCVRNVLFAVNASTYYGENVYVVGNATALGAWRVADAQPLVASNYTAQRPLWFGQVALEAGQVVSYGYVREENCGQPWLWEQGAGANRTVVLPACSKEEEENGTGEEPFVVTNDAWVGPVGSSGNC